MKVFVTGATGFVGSAVVRELLTAGHLVIGMARSDAGAASLAALGAEVHRGTLEDLGSLRSGADTADAVIHAAFLHDFSNYAHSAALDRQAIETLGTALAGTDRPLIVTSGFTGPSSGRPATEEDAAPANSPRFSEAAGLALISRGVRGVVMRLPIVHGEDDYGFVPTLIGIARATGVSAYPGDGSSRWASVHRLDAARLYRLGLESAPAGSRLHAVADECVLARDIATAIGRRLGLPVVSLPAEEVDAHFGWIGRFFATDLPASSALTRQRFGWYPEQASLLADLAQDHYFRNGQ